MNNPDCPHLLGRKGITILLADASELAELDWRVFGLLLRPVLSSAISEADFELPRRSIKREALKLEDGADIHAILKRVFSIQMNVEGAAAGGEGRYQKIPVFHYLSINDEDDDDGGSVEYSVHLHAKRVLASLVETGVLYFPAPS
jgi:hypothetical protein